MLNRRGSGILLHISSLPSPYGVGDLGKGAYRFADFLSAGKQNFWQILPLTPTSEFWGNSPYSSPSAFAGNPLLLSPELLLQWKMLSKSDLRSIPVFPRGRVDYRAVTRFKGDLFSTAFRKFGEKGKKSFAFENFCQENCFWLEDSALFGALKEHFGGVAWSRWPRGVRDREPGKIRAMKEKLRDRMEREIFLQYLFSRQWFSLKRFLNDRGIQVIGDAPIYVNYDSADVWANPEIFELDVHKRPLYVAGIPPDYFSATGQLWGNPIYRWDALKEKGYSWWIRRIGHNLKLFDFVRLDHFKGFVDFWEVPARSRTAAKGRWAPGPRGDFFDALLKHFPYLPFIAEDLGVITAEVQRLRDDYGFPGMRVLQFAFGSDPLADLYRPTHYIRNCVAYTGTHDNDTLVGWLFGHRDHSTRTTEEIRREKKILRRYLDLRGRRREEIHWEIIRVLMMSPAHLVIFPMQDLLGLGAQARMNRPGTDRGNWTWRLIGEQLTPSLGKRLGQMTEIYGRG
jgi:4-alpha-glucanotransferase